MANITSKVMNNGTMLLNQALNKSFLIKILILFINYLISNYIIDRLNHENLIKTFVENPNITIDIPNNLTFKILIIISMITISHYTYVLFIKQYIYKT
jgi:hypothetical protein